MKYLTTYLARVADLPILIQPLFKGLYKVHFSHRNPIVKMCPEVFEEIQLTKSEYYKRMYNRRLENES